MKWGVGSKREGRREDILGEGEAAARAAEEARVMKVMSWNFIFL